MPVEPANIDPPSELDGTGSGRQLSKESLALWKAASQTGFAAPQSLTAWGDHPWQRIKPASAYTATAETETGDLPCDAEFMPDDYVPPRLVQDHTARYSPWAFTRQTGLQELPRAKKKEELCPK